MRKYTQRELRNLVATGAAIDITYADNDKRVEIETTEEYLTQVGYASGICGCNGMLFEGCNSGDLYAITTRSQAIYIFG